MAKAESKMMGARIPAEWAEKIEAIALDEGVTAAEICREAFGKYLGKRGNGPSFGARLAKLEKQIKALQSVLIAGDDS